MNLVENQHVFLPAQFFFPDFPDFIWVLFLNLPVFPCSSKAYDGYFSPAKVMYRRDFGQNERCSVRLRFRTLGDFALGLEFRARMGFLSRSVVVLIVSRDCVAVVLPQSTMISCFRHYWAVLCSKFSISLCPSSFFPRFPFLFAFPRKSLHYSPLPRFSQIFPDFLDFREFPYIFPDSSL